jgi:hypothetical protein
MDGHPAASGERSPRLGDPTFSNIQSHLKVVPFGTDLRYHKANFGLAVEI